MRVKKVMKGLAEEKAAVPLDQGEAAKVDYELYQKEEMERRMREEALRNRLTSRYEDQQRLDKLNRLKIQDNWRRILRMIKLEELKRKIEILSQTHEHEVDRKDTLIAMLCRDLDEAEEQYQIALRAHLQTLDDVIDLQRNRLDALQNEYELAVGVIKAEFNAERQSILEQAAREREELQQVIYQIERDFAMEEGKVQVPQEFKEQQEFQMVHSMLKAQAEKLDEHFENAHTQFMRTNDQKQETFKMLMMRDSDAMSNMKQQKQRIQQLQDNIAYWRTKLQNNVRECEERNKALKEEKDAVQKHFQALKQRMVVFRDQEQKRLTHLTVVSDRCLKKLQAHVGLAERILHLMEMNRKLETEQEKVMPFYESTVEDPLPEVVEETKSYHASATTRDGRPVDRFNYLDYFFRRANKVELDRLALAQEREALQRENEDLRAILKQYLDGITINEEVLAGSNPLLIVNYQSNAVLPRVDTVRAPVVVEAAHVTQAIARQRG